MSEYSQIKQDRDASIQMFETVESNLYRVESQFNSLKYINFNASSIDNAQQQYNHYQEFYCNPAKKVQSPVTKQQLSLSQDISNKYHLFQIPPDWSKADNHCKARSVGISKKITDTQSKFKIEFCPCCSYQIENYISLRYFYKQNKQNQQKEQINLLDNPMVLSFLGSGYPLFFSFIKYCILILISIILFSGGFNLYTNFKGVECLQEINQGNTKQNAPCQADWISILTFINKSNDKQSIFMQNILNLITTIVLMILLVFFRIEQKQIDLNCDIKEITPSDFTILVKNIPNDVHEEELKKFFSFFQFENENQEVNIQFMNVKEVNYVYSLEQVELIERTLNNFITQKKNALSYIDPTSEQFRQVQNEWDEKINQLFNQKQASIKDIKDDNSNFSGYAFVSFEEEDDKQFILQTAQKDFWQNIRNYYFSTTTDFKELKYKNTILQITEAPEPLDIIWQNFAKSDNEKQTVRKISFYTTLFIMILCAYVIFVLSKYAQNEQDEYENNNQHSTKISTYGAVKEFILSQFQNVTISMAIIFINSIMIQLSFRYLVNLEWHNTHTSYNVKLAQKLTIALFINSALVICFINFVYTKNVYQNGGLIYTIFYYFAVDLIISVLSSLIDYEYFLRKIIKWWYKRQGQKCSLTQEEANKISEYPQHEIELCYADVMNTMYITIFYSSAVPIGLFLSLIGLTIYYWITKYMLIRRKKVDYQIGVKLSLEMTNYLEFIIPIYAISNALFEWNAIDRISTLQIITICIGILYSIIPTQLILEHVIDFEIQNETVTYTQGLPNFVTTYYQANPLTSIQRKTSSFKKQSDSFNILKF